MVSDRDMGKLYSCLGYALRKVRNSNISSEVESLLWAAILRQRRQSSLDSHAGCSVHARVPIKLVEHLTLVNPGHGDAQADGGVTAGHSGGSLTNPDTCACENEAFVAVGHTHLATDSRSHRDISNVGAGANVKLAPQKVHDRSEARGDELTATTVEAIPSFIEDPEGFVHRYAALAANDEEAVRGLQPVLADLREEHRRLPHGAQRSWLIRACVCIRAEIRNYGGCPV